MSVAAMLPGKYGVATNARVQSWQRAIQLRHLTDGENVAPHAQIMPALKAAH